MTEAGKLITAKEAERRVLILGVILAIVLRAIMILIGFGYEVHPEVSKVFSPWYGCGFGA